MLLRLLSRPIRLSRTMSTSTAPTFKPFNLALIQLGGVTDDKSANLSHAREMLLKAARGEGAKDRVKPDLIVLPVGLLNSPCY
jgi:omega-amidase